jgi:hypothetical protein
MVYVLATERVDEFVSSRDIIIIVSIVSTSFLGVCLIRNDVVTVAEFSFLSIIVLIEFQRIHIKAGSHLTPASIDTRSTGGVHGSSASVASSKLKRESKLVASYLFVSPVSTHDISCGVTSSIIV